MTEQDNRVVRVCSPDCDGHPGKFRFMLAPKVTTLADLSKVVTFDLTPDQAADAFDQFMQTTEGEKAMIHLLEKMLEVRV